MDVLTSYLDAVEKGNIDEMVKNVKDARYDSKESMKVDYTQMLKKKDQQLIEYKIIEKNKLSSTVYEFITELYFKDGSVYQAPFILIYEDKSWKVSITETSLENSINYIELRSATVYEDNTNIINDNEVVKVQSNLVTWHFWDRRDGSTFYSTGVFNINNQSNITLAFTQFNQRAGGPGPHITYAVVKQRWFGDDVWGSTIANGNYFSEITRTVSGKSANFSDAQIRFTISSTVNTERFK